MKVDLRKRVAILFVLAAALCMALPAAAQSAGVVHKTLPNGLEVFVVENHTVPLATICVAFRCGAISQTPENAGLFHLYEHMLFTGNEKYPNQAAFTGALNRMGVSNWNGGTGTESVDYYITIPSSKLGEGIEFWSWAVKKPVFQQAKLDTEKGVVINEIQGYHADPDQIADNALESRMYGTYPWRKNIDGPEANIQNATLAQLEAMRRTYYIPKNTALFVSGDVKPAEVYAFAEKWFGDWKGGDAPVIGEPAQAPIPKDVRIVYPDGDFYDGVAQVDFRWRAPDVMRQTKDTYTSDVFLYLLSSPVGRFKQALMEKVPGLYDPEYISFNYPTARDGGTYYFSTYMLLDNPETDGATIDRVAALEKAVREEFALIAKDPAAYFGAEELAKAKAKLIDLNLLSTEVPSSYVTDTLVFWWAVATTDYFFGYEANCAKVSFDDIKGLINGYLVNSPCATALRLKSDFYDGEPGMADLVKSQGYTVVGADNAFWWQK